MEERVLHMTLMKKWFDLIECGEKKFEYREIKDYWTARLFELNGDVKDYTHILFRNGYAKDARKMKVEFKGVGFGELEGKRVYVIELGLVLFEGENHK